MKLLPTKIQTQYLVSTSRNYVSTINYVFNKMRSENKVLKLSSATIDVSLPSALKNQAIRDGKSLYIKFKKKGEESFAKKPVAIWNNQNYKIKIHTSGKKATISFPVFVDGKSRRIEVLALLSEYQVALLKNELGTLRIVQKGHKWVAQIGVNCPPNHVSGTKIMGVDVGQRVPAVAVTEDGKTKFFGNGRLNKYMRRIFKAVRVILGKSKKINAIKKNRNKEQRWMRDQDHKIARSIVEFAKRHNVSIILLECLIGIRNTARTSRKNAKNLHMWSFHRLLKFIEYKAKTAGIKVEYVNPRNTSKTCPKCGDLNVTTSRRYRCACGFKTHRDIVGAMNIRHATVVGGVAHS
jgi:putative transposase